jgi:hypothetical protein
MLRRRTIYFGDLPARGRRRGNASPIGSQGEPAGAAPATAMLLQGHVGSELDEEFL